MIGRTTQARLADQFGEAWVNETLALVRPILQECVRDWQWLQRAPAVTLRNQPTCRNHDLTHSEADDFWLNFHGSFAPWRRSASQRG